MSHLDKATETKVREAAETVADGIKIFVILMAGYILILYGLHIARAPQPAHLLGTHVSLTLAIAGLLKGSITLMLSGKTTHPRWAHGLACYVASGASLGFYYLITH